MEAPELTAYEQERQKRLAQNAARMQELGLQQVGGGGARWKGNIGRHQFEGFESAQPLPGQRCGEQARREPTAAPSRPAAAAVVDHRLLLAAPPPPLPPSPLAPPPSTQMAKDMETACGGEAQPKKKREKRAAPEAPLEPTRR